ncbi:hypothetical protein B0H14DRAFT_2636107 [Mycena olivaceomarginata]|nr:hypothetical protein B0H14DRAFT_2636107 [Mycena olivaceomarginata]
MQSLRVFGSDKSHPSNKSHAPPDAPEESRDAVMYPVANDLISRQHKEHNTAAVAVVWSSVDDAVTWMRAVYATDQGQLLSRNTTSETQTHGSSHANCSVQPWLQPCAWLASLSCARLYTSHFGTWPGGRLWSPRLQPGAAHRRFPWPRARVPPATAAARPPAQCVVCIFLPNEGGYLVGRGAAGFATWGSLGELSRRGPSIPPARLQPCAAHRRFPRPRARVPPATAARPPACSMRAGAVGWNDGGCLVGRGAAGFATWRSLGELDSGPWRVQITGIRTPS